MYSSLSPEAPEFQPSQPAVSPLIDASSPEPVFRTPAAIPVHSRHTAPGRESRISLPQISETVSSVTHDLPPSETSHSSDSDSDIGVLDLFSSVGLCDSDCSQSSSDDCSSDSDSQISGSDVPSYYQPVLCERSDLYHSCLSLQVPIRNWIYVRGDSGYATITRGKYFYKDMLCTNCDKKPAHRELLSWDKYETFTWKYFCSLNCRKKWQEEISWTEELVE